MLYTLYYLPNNSGLSRPLRVQESLSWAIDEERLLSSCAHSLVSNYNFALKKNTMRVTNEHILTRNTYSFKENHILQNQLKVGYFFHKSLLF
jgi:hypothetical protein